MAPTQRSVSIENTRLLVKEKFGKEVKVISERKREGVHPEYLLEYSGRCKWVTIRNIRDRTLAGTLFLSSSDAKAFALKHIKYQNNLKHTNFIKRKLRDLELNDVEFVKRKGIGQKSLLYFRFKEQLIPVNSYFFDYQMTDALHFYKRLYAWIRFKSKIPLKFSDQEWRLKVEAASGGTVTSKRFVPKGYGDNELQCLRCNLKFKKHILFNVKNYVIRCPDCDLKQNKRYSTKGVDWIKDLSKRFRITIRHAESERGEARIYLKDGTHIYVDGLYKKIIFEYHGSRWHGDPTQFYVDEHPNPYDKKNTTLHFLRKTMNRELAIMDAGYKLIRIWEADFVFPERYSQWLLINSKRLQTFLTQK